MNRNVKFLIALLVLVASAAFAVTAFAQDDGTADEPPYGPMGRFGGTFDHAAWWDNLSAECQSAITAAREAAGPFGPFDHSSVPAECLPHTQMFGTGTPAYGMGMMGRGGGSGRSFGGRGMGMNFPEGFGPGSHHPEGMPYGWQQPATGS